MKVKFYNNLYSKTNVNNRTIESYFERVRPKEILNNHEKKFCDAKITKKELSDIVQSLKRNKSPGLDGLTSEFYQTFWEDLQCIFIRMIDESFNKGILPCSIKKAVITVIFKKGDRTLLKNYRPISLTNCDYKILTFVLARRIQKVIPKLISNDQSGYIKGRYIGFNARLINDIIENCEKKNLPGAIVCLDFEKAFDSLDWKFMIISLKRYGFGDYFTRWIKMLYTSPTYCIKNNGWISKESAMNRGIRQGCAVSALLFILMILHPLGIDINQLLKMNFRTKTGLAILSRIPKFYQDIFIYFNMCKTIKPALKLNNIELFSQIIWGNEYFKMNDQYLFYKNWLESGFIYVKDLFDNKGSWLTESAILCKLKNKTNWIAEWTLIKKVVGKQTKKFDSTICPYIQNSIFKQTRFFANDKFYDYNMITAKDSYQIFIQKKFKKPYTQNMWHRMLNCNITKDQWKTIYAVNMKLITNKKFCEFKYKILMNILPCGQKISKWNRNVSELCAFCNLQESIVHMLFSCKRVQNIWACVSACLKVNIGLKDIVLGLNGDYYVEINKHLCITMVSYSIYSLWIKCSFENVSYKTIDLKRFVKQQISFYSKVYIYLHVFSFKQRSHLQKLLHCIILSLN